MSYNFCNASLRRSHLKALLLAGVVAMVPLTAAQAQQRPDPQPAEASQEEPANEEIIVTGTRRSLEDALATKRDANEVLDSISAEGIGKLPDLNLAESLQRLPGVQINRLANRRSGTVAIRGLPGDFSQTLLNGQFLASPSVTNFSFGTVRSEVFSGIDVRKSPGASTLTGGLSGLVNLRTGNPLSSAEQFTVTADGRYEELTKGIAPGGAMVLSKKIIPDVLGIRLAAGYRNENFRQDVFQVQAYERIAGTATTADASDDVYTPRQFRLPSLTAKGDTYTLAGTVEFKPTPTLTATLRGFYNSYTPDFDENQFLVETTATTTRTVLETTNDGALGQTQSHVILANARTQTDSRYSDIAQLTGAVTGELTWASGGWMVQGIAHYTRATRKEDVYGYAVQQASGTGAVSNGFSVEIDTGAGVLRNASYTQRSGSPRPNLQQPFGAFIAPTYRETRAVAQPLVSVFGGFRNLAESEDETSFQFNVARDLNFGPIVKIEAGGVYREKFQDQRNFLQTMFGVDTTKFSNSFYDYSLFDGGMRFLGSYADQIDRTGLAELDVRKINALLTPTNLATLPANTSVGAGGFVQLLDSTALAATYDNTQKIRGGYGQITLDQAIGSLLHLRGLIGLRYEKSERSTTSRSTTNQPVVSNFSYDNWLPSSNLVLEVGKNVIVRASYVRTLRRPQVDSFAVLRSIAVDGAGSLVTINLGASDLRPFIADNYDLALEWYNRAGSSISVTAFKKDITDYAGTTRICPADGGGFGFGPLSMASGTCRTTQDTPAAGSFPLVRSGVSTLINVTANQDAFTVKGVEISVQQNLSFLPAPWKYFGGQVNYTRIDQSSKSNFRLAEVSNDQVNGILYFETPQFSLRGAANYRSGYLVGAGLDRAATGRTQIDLSAQINLTDRFTLSMEAFNITNEIVYSYENSTNRARQYNVDGRTFSAGVSYRF